MAFPVIKTKKEAEAVVYGLSKPGKMPGPAWGLNADACHRGARMAKVAGSICSRCYAQKGNYTRTPAPKQAQDRRLAAFTRAERRLWVAAMVRMIKGQKAFRWFDSGDLQSPEMLVAIVEVAHLTPETDHWLASREIVYIRLALAMLGAPLPPNIVIRVSADFTGQKPVNRVTPWSSTVHDAKDPSTIVPGAFICPAPQQKNQCGSCRACWDRDVPLVSYKDH